MNELHVGFWVLKVYILYVLLQVDTLVSIAWRMFIFILHKFKKQNLENPQVDYYIRICLLNVSLCKEVKEQLGSEQ